MKVDNLWVLCSRTLVWHRVILGKAPAMGEPDPPMAKLFCEGPEVLGTWVLREWGQDLPGMGMICDCCGLSWEIDYAKRLLDD